MAKLIRIEQWITILFILGAAFIGVVQIILRYLFGSGFVWSDGIVIMLTVGGSLTAAATVIEKRGHIAVDILVQKMPRQWQKLMSIFANLMTATFVTVLCILSLNHLKFLYFFGGTSLITYLPMWLEFLVLPGSLTLMVVHSIAHLIRSIREERLS